MQFDDGISRGPSIKRQKAHKKIQKAPIGLFDPLFSQYFRSSSEKKKQKRLSQS